MRGVFKQTSLPGVILLALLALGILAEMGCDGVQGPPGPDAEDYDHRPPDITLLYPTSTTDIIGDTLTLFAEARDTLGAIAQVEFLVNGSSDNGSLLAVVEEEPFEFTWDFSLDSTPYGPVSIQAIASDTAGNHQATPLFFVNRQLYEGLDTLAYWVPGADESIWAIPSWHEVYDEDGQITDTTWMDQFGSRFTSRGDGNLLSTAFYFESNANYTPPPQLWISLYRLDDSFAPSVLDSILVPFSEENLDGWWEVDLSTLDNGQPYHVDAAENLLVVVRLDEGDLTEDSGVVLVASSLSTFPDDRLLDRGWMRTELLGWETVGEHYRDYGEFLPKMRVVLDYGTGMGR